MVQAYAPYNFVPFPKKIKVRYESYEHLPKHDGTDPSGEDLLSGEVLFEIEAKTPILVAQGAGKRESEKKSQYRFNTDVDSRYEIPGSTLRGLLRHAIGIIGHSDLTKDIADDAKDMYFMYRGMADAKERRLKQRKKDYVAIINKENVRAGYIRKVAKDQYEIIPAQVIHGKTYAFVREQQLYKGHVVPNPKINAMYSEDILELEKIGRPKPPAKKIKLSPAKVTLQGKNQILQEYRKQLKEYKTELAQNPRPAGETLDKLAKKYNELYGLYYAYLKQCENTRNNNRGKVYEPYYLNGVTVFISDDGRYSFEKGRGKPYRCALMSSGLVPKKQSHYIIHPPDETKSPIPLDKWDVKSYQYDWEIKGNRLKNRDYYALPKEGEMKPCFYCDYGGRKYFGFTPFMRVFYKHSVGAGLPKYSYHGFDYVDALFGFTGRECGDEKLSYAGRLSFKSAVALDRPEPLDPVEITPGQPRLSAVAMYIEQDKPGELITMNDEDYKWRGIKQYWLKEDFRKPEPNLKGARENEKTKAELYLLPKGTRFRASIRFDRLHRDELGLLLAALTWPKHQTIGKGKPYGAGCVTFSNIKFRLDTMRFDLTDYFAAPFAEVDKSEFESYIQAFLAEMKDVCEDVRESLPVRVYLAMRERPYDFDTGYMPLSGPRNAASYQMMLPLPTAGELLGMV